MISEASILWSAICNKRIQIVSLSTEAPVETGQVLLRASLTQSQAAAHVQVPQQGSCHQQK